MPFDGFTIRTLCSELNELLRNARIDKIYQPEKDELSFSIRQFRMGSLRLLISANARWSRLHIDSAKKSNPVKPPAFCMLLRKYLEGGKIKEIEQIDFERIIQIRIEALDDFREWKDKLLICEFMGRHSNIILVNPETNIIIDAIKRYGSELSSYREVLPGKEYKAPPPQGKLNPLAVAFEEFTRHMWEQDENSSLASAIFQVFSGISPFSAREICLGTGLDPDLAVEQCGENELNRVFYAIRELLQDIDEGNIKPVVLYDNNLPLDYAVYDISRPSPSTQFHLFSSMNAACDSFYQDKLQRIRLESMKINFSKNIKVVLDKAYKKRFYQEGDVVKAQENLKYQLWGELLTVYGHQLSKGQKAAIVNNFYNDETMEIALDPRYTPMQNAQKYYKLYNKSKKALQHLENLMAKNQAEIDYLESVMVMVKQAETPGEVSEIMEELEKEFYQKERRSRTATEKSQPRKFISTDGLVILVGRNNRQNDLLTLKQAEKHDLWLHSQQIPGTHVIIKLPKETNRIEEVPDASLEEAAGLAAYFSKAGQSEKVPVDYTFRSNVRKPGGAKPGMVIYDNYWTIMVNPLSERIKQLIR
ncbi:MAG: NFACT RNA binding domain-containing protein [Syntrophomonadaceae bacterium]|nr:NFACT RNA binding domain-containing protein [Syntrophomonadaceae bacterium]MDD3023357.1 NFACT RNA binding domain-containing protein [Syntrophomonadaceae bacterium]